MQLRVLPNLGQWPNIDKNELTENARTYLFVSFRMWKKITGPKWASVTDESRFFVVFFLLVEIVKFFV